MPKTLSNRHLLGLESERSALKWFLSHQGGRLLEKNYRCRGGEIDLIFEKETQLVFVEVRARVGGFASGLESVDWKKRKRLSRTIRWFMVAYRGRATEIRVDVLQWDGNRWTHFPNQWIDP
jgi:putative endonuclease